MKCTPAHYSLRRRLLAWISFPIILATLLAMISSYCFARLEIEEVYDAQLVHSAKFLLQLTQHEISKNDEFYLGLENPDLQHRYERNLGFRIWAGNDLIAQSLSTEKFGDFEAEPGFSNHIVNAKQWRFFVFLDPAHKIRIEVSERYDIRYELIVQLMISLLVPALLFLPVILLIIWIGVRKILRPVVTISSDVDKRGGDDLSPIANHAMPQEIAPLVVALNRLFRRLEDSFKREREFTDHAAHELRTPLAAMKTQTQVLMRKARSMPDCADGLENLQSSIDRATHLVEQLLSLARLQHEDLPQERTDLSHLLADIIKDIAPHAQRKNITLSSDLAPERFICAHSMSVSIMLRNILDNAVKYTPENGRVNVSLAADGLLTIADTGPGLDDADKARVFGRFVRADRTGQAGSGLGLSIAQWIAHAHGVEIKLADNIPQGLQVQIQWKVIT
ncbi:MAG TPA: ATP-binding protein [Micavibrio sp.]